MNESNPLIIYSKSTNTSYNYFVISLIMIITYVLISKKIPRYFSFLLKYITIGLLFYTLSMILYNNYSYISKLKKDLFKNKYANLRNSILCNTLFSIFIFVLIYNFIYF